MATPSGTHLNNLLNNAPPQTSTSPQPAPWTAPTPDRILRTTAVPVLLNYSSASWAPQQWGPNTAAFSAVSPPDPTTNQQYFCLVPSGGMRFDFSLNRAGAPGQSSSQTGEFTALPALDAPGNFTAYLGWAYAVDSSTGTHYFLCAASWAAPVQNTLLWTPLNTAPGPLGPLPVMKHYQPKSTVVQPQGLWTTGELIWFANTDGSLWQVAISDVVGNTNGSLQQVNSIGVVQAVISDGASTPTYYVLSAVQNDNSYDLVEFPAGDPGSAVTIQTNWTLGGIKTTPDGGVWRVVPDFSSTDPTQPTAAQVAYLVPTFPSNGQTPTWIDPFANADPTFYPTGTTQTIMDAVPLSATNILLRTTANYAAEQDLDTWNYQDTWQLTRVAIGVLDQPAIAFPAYTDDAATAYTQISEALIDAPSASYDIRAQYPTLSSSEADGYYTKISTLSMPSDFSDPSAWQQVQSELSAELFNLTFMLSFWEGTQALVSLQDQLKTQAINYVSGALAIPTEATLIDKSAGSVNALTVIGGSAGGVASIIGLASTVMGACTLPVGAIITGVLSTAASLVSLFCSTSASLTTDYVINVSDPMYLISAKLGDLENILNQLFSNTLTEISSSLQACATDAGRLVTVAELVRNESWLNNTAQVVQDATSSGSGTPPTFDDYYNACVVSFLQAFVPLITAVNTQVPPQGKAPDFPTYKGDPVYLSPIHTFTDSYGQVWCGQLLQYASAHDQSKPLGQDLDPLLFQTYNIPYVEVFLDWLIPNKPSWLT